MHLAIPQWLNGVHGGLALTQATTFIILIAAIIVLSFLINTILAASIGGIYRVFVAPGIIVHELSHALGCIITGARIHSIDVFKKDGGEVRHEAPKIPVIGQIIISLAPFVVGALLIYYIAKVVGMKTIGPDYQQTLLRDPVAVIWQMIRSIDFGMARSWLAFYLILSIAVTMTPSLQDLRNITLSIIAIIIIFYLLIKYFGVSISLGFLLRPELLAIISSCVLILIGALFLSIILAVIVGVVKR